MVFSSTAFLLIFAPIVMILYHIIDNRFKNTFILIASIFFYMWGAPNFIFLLIGSAVVDFYLVRCLYQAETINRKRIFLIISLTMNIGLLAYFKYANFFIENVNEVFSEFGWNTVEWTKIVLPIGISFYTFQTLTYSVDVYRNVHKPLNKLKDYLFFILLFPQMIAGPIVRFNQIADEIQNRNENIDDKLQGFIRFCIGLGKKVLIANVLGQQADLIMNQPIENIGSLTAWLGIITYSFQIYFDFAGYSDMAIGLGKMLGLHFPENFNNPYTSRSISEFWRRWHITLGDFMKNYLYIPLGGNRVSPTHMFFNLWLVFLISGFWHGASWNFVIWGAFHGLFLILDKLFLLKALSRIGQIPSMLFTFLIVMIGWVFFRMEHFTQATGYLKKMFSFETGKDLLPISKTFYIALILSIVFSWITTLEIGRVIERHVFYTTAASVNYYAGMLFVCIILFILCVASITSADFNPFIYFRF